MQQAITWANFMTPYDVIGLHWINGDLMPDKMKGACVDGSDCQLHMDIPSYKQNLFCLIWNNYI